MAGIKTVLCEHCLGLMGVDEDELRPVMTCNRCNKPTKTAGFICICGRSGFADPTWRSWEVPGDHTRNCYYGNVHLLKQRAKEAKMQSQSKRFLEEIDAAVFSGDLLFTDLEEFKQYVERWSRAITEHEEIEAEEAEAH